MHVLRAFSFTCIMLLSLNVQAADDFPTAQDSASTREILGFLNTQPDQAIINVLGALELGARPKVVLASIERTEKLLIKRGWSKCHTPLLPDSSSPVGFQFFWKDQMCFHSLIENSSRWMTSFFQAPVEQQSVFFAAVEFLRRQLERK